MSDSQQSTRRELNTSRTGAQLLGALFLANLAVLVIHAYNGTYTRFIADDYCSAGSAAARGILGATFAVYRAWTGRFSASLLDSVTGAIGPAASPYLTGGAVFLWLLTLSGALRRIIALRGTPHSATADRWHALAIAAGLIVATLQLTPDINQSLYWGQGMRSVVPPLICGAVFVWLALVYRDSSGGQPGWLAVMGLTAFVAGGFNETFTALQILAFFIALAAWSLSSRESRSARILLTGLCASLLALLVVMLAPGNAVRRAYFPAPPDIHRLVGISRWAAEHFAWDNLVTRDSLIALLSVLALGLLSSYFTEQRFRHARTALWVLPIATVLVAWASFLPAAYAMSGAPPPRNLIIVCFVICSAIYSWGLLAGQVLRDAGYAERRTWPVAIGVAIATAAVYAAVMQLERQGTLRDYAVRWDLMDAAVREARAEGKTDYVVPNLQNPAGLRDIGPNGRWVNACANGYYRIRLRTADQRP